METDTEIEELLQTSVEDYIHAELQVQPSIPDQAPTTSQQQVPSAPTPEQLAPVEESSAKQGESPQASVSAIKKRQKPGKFTAQKLESREYSLQFKGNDSQQWDGKVIRVDAEWLEELYSQQDLFPGRVAELPWDGKDGKSVGWKGVIVSLPASEGNGGEFCFTERSSI